MAYDKFGAVWGNGVGLQGQSYAIPTMQGGVGTIKPYVDDFIRFAKDHPGLTFLVTRIGCGIAGFRDGEIAYARSQGKTVKSLCPLESASEPKVKRVTPAFITELREGDIFVFGSVCKA